MLNRFLSLIIVARVNVIPCHKNRSFASLLLILAVFVQCNKDSGDQGDIRIKLINASPNSTPLIFKLNSKAANTPALAYPDTTSYLPFAAGTYNLSIEMGSLVSINTIIDFIPQKAYSLFAVDSSGKLKLSVVADDTSANYQQGAKIRYFNLSPNSSSLGLMLTANKDTIRLAAIAFNTQTTAQSNSAFQAISATTYNIHLVDGTAIVATLSSRQLLINKAYTIVAKGFKGGSGLQALSLSVIVNQ